MSTFFLRKLDIKKKKTAQYITVLTLIPSYVTYLLILTEANKWVLIHIRIVGDLVIWDWESPGATPSNGMFTLLPWRREDQTPLLINLAEAIGFVAPG